jgi:hypothetical protein
MWGALSDESTGLSLATSAGPRQRSHFQVWVTWDPWPYFTLWDSRLPCLSPSTTRRVMVEVFDPASTRESTYNSFRAGTHYNCNVQRNGCCNHISLTAWLHVFTMNTAEQLEFRFRFGERTYHTWLQQPLRWTLQRCSEYPPLDANQYFNTSDNDLISPEQLFAINFQKFVTMTS